MNKHFSKIAALSVGLAMAFGVGVAVSGSDNGREVAQVEAASPVTLTTNSLSGTSSDGNISWTAIKGSSGTAPGIFNDGIRLYQNGGFIQLQAKNGNKITGFTAQNTGTYSTTANYAISESAFSTTSTPANAGTNASVAKNGTYSISGLDSTYVAIICRGSDKNSRLEISSISVTYVGSAPAKTVTGLTVLDGEAKELSDGDEINVVGSGESASTEVTCEVAYSSGDPDGLVDITSNPSSGFTVSTLDNSTYTMTFGANGDYSVTIASSVDSNFAINATYHVSGVVNVVYEKVTSASNLKAEKKLLVGKSDGTFVLGKYASGNNSPALSVVPTDENNIPASALPNGYALLTLGGSEGAWTLTDQDNNIYYGVEGQNQLKASSTSTDTWTITIDGSGVASIHSNSTESGRYLMKNKNSPLFACYTSAQSDVSIYMIPSTDPAIEVSVTGSTSLSVGSTATLTATKINGATGTIEWSKNNDHVSLGTPVVDGNSSTVIVTGMTDGSTNITASLTGGSTVNPVVTAFTVTKQLSSISVSTAPTKTAYTEGELFDNAGMVVTATYDDGSSENPTDYTWSPDGALIPSDTEVTISWGGKSTTQAITVAAKVVSSIAVKELPTKNSYHVGDEFDSAGLVIRVSYEGGSTADIASGFKISPESYTFTEADKELGSKTFTVTYDEKSTTFDVSVVDVAGPIPSGRYYIMNSDKTYGLNAEAASASPNAVSLNTANELTAFDVELKADNEYEISVTINDIKYYLVCNTTATSSSNTSIRVTDSPVSLVSLNWSLDDTDVDTDGAYHVKENTVGTTNRYLSYYTDDSTKWDWRGYTAYKNAQGNKNGDPEIQFVPENSYAEAIADSLLNDLTCDASGETAPSTSVWGNISSAFAGIKISYEKSLLTSGTADKESADKIEKALAKYDYIVGKYGTDKYSDFMSRNPKPILVKNINNIDLKTSNSYIVVIIAISSVAVLSLGVLLILKKKKHN